MDQKLAKLLDEAQRARAINLAEPLIFPLIQEMIDLALNDAVIRFKEGHTDFVAYIARISSLKDLEAEFKTMQSRGNSAHDKLAALNKE